MHTWIAKKIKINLAFAALMLKCIARSLSHSLPVPDPHLDLRVSECLFSPLPFFPPAQSYHWWLNISMKAHDQTFPFDELSIQLTFSNRKSDNKLFFPFGTKWHFFVTFFSSFFYSMKGNQNTEITFQRDGKMDAAHSVQLKVSKVMLHLRTCACKLKILPILISGINTANEIRMMITL